VVTSGGVSVGDADHTRAPGPPRPGGLLVGGHAAGPPFRLRAAGSADRAPCWLLRLPGNPVAALVSFPCWRGALLTLSGADRDVAPLLRARCASAFASGPVGPGSSRRHRTGPRWHETQVPGLWLRAPLR
jgi:molybdopterin molybdotransferase